MLGWFNFKKRARGHFERGTAHAQRGDFAAAIADLERAVKLDPKLAAAHFNLANAYRDSGRLDASLAAFQRAAALSPASGADLYIGAILREQGRVEESLGPLSRALSGSGVAEAHMELGNAHTALGNWREAIEHFHAAARMRPEAAPPRWAAAVAQIPAIAEAGSNPEERRHAFSAGLDAFDQWRVGNDRGGLHSAVAVHQPFYLAYQELPNRELLSRYGKLSTDLMGAWQKRSGLEAPARRAKASPMKVGIVSAHIEDHSVWTALVRGWVAGLDPQRFDLHIYHLGGARGAESRFAASHAAEFHDGKRSFEQWAQRIHGDRLDALIYPEIGMDATTGKLAALRLAPVQAASWGHPETSGLPTMDYYLSAEGMEPPDAQANYTEKLVALPNLGVSVSESTEKPEPFGLEGTLLVCPGTPFKYAPQHDRVLAEIARRVPEATLLFFTGKPAELSRKLEERLAAAGVKATFLPWMTRARFHGLLARADLFLDTIGFSGFNTALAAVESGIPIVTREGRFLRGRFGSGILKRMEMPELVVSSENDYIELAVALAKDAGRRQALRKEIEAKRGVLFDDPAPVAALQEFLLRL